MILTILDSMIFVQTKMHLFALARERPEKQTSRNKHGHFKSDKKSAPNIQTA
jgi:hypothetical protein